METPFDFDQLTLANGEESIETKLGPAFIKSFDLSKSLELPMHAAYVWGESLIPLFHWSKVTSEEKPYLNESFENNGLTFRLPDHHPIL